MRILILGGDGYLGWPTAMYLSAHSHQVMVVDNYLRRHLCLETDSTPLLNTPNLPERVAYWKAVSGHSIEYMIGDCCNFEFLSRVVKEYQPDSVVHYAEQPSGPYSMIGPEEARLTLRNNLESTFNLIWAIHQYAPQAQIIKLGTMGEYGTPNIDIEEGWLNIEHQGRSDRFLFPRQAASLYHTTKIQDTDLLWFYVRTWGLRVTDLMQGPVYGLITEESGQDPSFLTNFNYDDIFGTVLNRFMVQAVAGVPLTVYGKGGQTRGYLNIEDTIRCIELVAQNPAKAGELRIFNQFTEQFTVIQLAEKVQEAGKYLGLEVEIQSIPNPRKEAEEHYYNAKHTGLVELGLTPHLLTQEVIVEMLQVILKHQNQINLKLIMPRVSWSK